MKAHATVVARNSIDVTMTLISSKEAVFLKGQADRCKAKQVSAATSKRIGSTPGQGSKVLEGMQCPITQTNVRSEL
jgi:hypothetical protein